jgi:hypothetical protein
MSDTTHQPRWRRLLDGGHTWGSIDVSPPRYGVSRYRLVVFPPGISADDRVLLRAWRAWPVWGIAVFLALEIVLVPVLGSGQALGTSAAVFLGAGAVLMAMTGPHRHGIHTMSVVRTAGADDASVVGKYVELQSLADDLAVADRRLIDGEIDAAEHECLVWRVYDRMASV